MKTNPRNCIWIFPTSPRKKMKHGEASSDFKFHLCTKKSLFQNVATIFEGEIIIYQKKKQFSEDSTIFLSAFFFLIDSRHG